MKTRTGYLHKRGSNFYVSWRDKGKLSTKLLRDKNGQPITIKRDAEVARDELMSTFALQDEVKTLKSIQRRIEDKNADIAALDKETPMRLEQAMPAFLVSPARRDTGGDTLAVYQGQFGQFIDWMKDNYPAKTALQDVTTDVAEKYAGYLKQQVNEGELTANTFNKHMNMLQLVFRVLFRPAKLMENPWVHPKKGGTIERMALTTKTRSELTVDDLRRVCENAKGEMRTLFAIGIYTGLRLLDCATLLWGETDLKRGTIIRMPNKIKRKATARPVIVPIHPALMAILEDTPADKRTGYILPQIAVKYAAGGRTKRNVIDSIQGHFAAQGVQIYEPGTGPGTGKRAVVRVGFHSLRHTFVSICRESNVPLAVVESIVGHSNPAMTRHYTHLGENTSRAAVACLPTIIGEVKAQPVKQSPEAILAKLRGILEGLTPDNAVQLKGAMLALIDGKPLEIAATV